jgi:hypothetical protein
LKINVNKCAQISFTRKNKPILHNYSLDSHKIKIVSSIKDLGIILSSDLTFSEHISYVHNEAMRMLGFIRRQCWDFNNIHCLRTLYCSLVRSNIEYGSILWNPSQSGHINSLNKIQSNFLRYLSNKFAIHCTIDELASNLGLNTLSSKRKFIDISFIYKILNDQIKCPEILVGNRLVGPYFLLKI